MPKMDLIDLRNRRAESLTAAVMAKIEPYLCWHGDDVRQHVSELLVKLFSADGVEVLTDDARKQFGLPPRDYKGWTLDEMVALERLRLRALLHPMPIMLFPSPQ